VPFKCNLRRYTEEVEKGSAAAAAKWNRKGKAVEGGSGAPPTGAGGQEPRVTRGLKEKR
jgi:hypothetical protein